MSPFFRVSIVHLRLYKASKLSTLFPSCAISFLASNLKNYIIMRKRMHIHPYTLIKYFIYNFVCFLISESLGTWNRSPKSLLLRLDRRNLYFCTPMSMLCQGPCTHTDDRRVLNRLIIIFYLVPLIYSINSYRYASD